MAMIQCPECGNTVSDKASSCIHCGAPLKLDKSVKIKIPRFVTGIANQKASEALVKCGQNVVWRGFSGQVAQFEVGGTTKAEIVILQAYTGHPGPFFRDFSIFGEVEMGKKYEVRNARVSMLFGDPTRSEWVLSNVDVIDSGN